MMGYDIYKVMQAKVRIATLRVLLDLQRERVARLSERLSRCRP